MNENISFKKLNVMIKTSGYSVAEFAEKCGLKPTEISTICNSRRTPRTDLVAKMCSIFECYPSDIVTFKGITVNNTYFSDDKRYALPYRNSGELTYRPLFLFLADYLEEHKDKTEKDFFDQIEPPRRIKGQSLHTSANIKKAIAARYGEGYESPRHNRTDYSKGLNAVTRAKLRNDRPMNLSIIYEICKFLGCTVDFVLGYK